MQIGDLLTVTLEAEIYFREMKTRGFTYDTGTTLVISNIKSEGDALTVFVKDTDRFHQSKSISYHMAVAMRDEWLSLSDIELTVDDRLYVTPEFKKWLKDTNNWIAYEFINPYNRMWAEDDHVCRLSILKGYITIDSLHGGRCVHRTPEAMVKRMKKAYIEHMRKMLTLFP